MIFITIVKEWEKGVKFAFGKYKSTLNSGLRLKIPFYHTIVKVNMATKVKDLHKQALISRDNVSFTVHSSIQYKIIDAQKSVINIENLDKMLVERCQMALRSTLSQLEINDVLHNISNTTNTIKESLKLLSDDWGIEIESVQLTEITFDESMKRAMAVKAEADRNAEAKMINARSDVDTARLYADAAKIYNENPTTMRLREFQLWTNISKNPNNTLFVIPSNLLDIIKK